MFSWPFRAFVVSSVVQRQLLAGDPDLHDLKFGGNLLKELEKLLVMFGNLVEPALNSLHLLV